jgi:hypothetical protein
MTYGIIFWGYSKCSVKVVMMQKRMIRIMTNLTPRDSCRVMFKELKILPFFFTIHLLCLNIFSW